MTAVVFALFGCTMIVCAHIERYNDDMGFACSDLIQGYCFVLAGLVLSFL